MSVHDAYPSLYNNYLCGHMAPFLAILYTHRSCPLKYRCHVQKYLTRSDAYSPFNLSLHFPNASTLCLSLLLSLLCMPDRIGNALFNHIRLHLHQFFPTLSEISLHKLHDCSNTASTVNSWRETLLNKCAHTVAIGNLISRLLYFTALPADLSCKFQLGITTKTFPIMT